MVSSPKTVELLLRPRIALLRGPTIPPNGFHAIPLHAPTVFVHPAEVGLPARLALVGRKAKPSDGFTVVLRYSATVPVHEAKVGLS